MTRKAVKAGVASATAAAHDATVITVDGRVAKYLNQQRTAKATEERRKPTAGRKARARELRAEGHSAVVIGKKIAREENRENDYPERTVRRWLSDVATKKRVTD